MMRKWKTWASVTGVTIAASVLLVCCSKDPKSLNLGMNADGEWKLAQIRCDGQESSLIPDTALATGQGVGSTVSITSTNGERDWVVNGCTATVPMSGISYPSPGIMHVSDGIAACSGSSCSNMPQCQTATSVVADYPYTIDDQSMTLTLPANVKSALGAPCGSGQGTGTVTFTYFRQ